MFDGRYVWLGLSVRKETIPETLKRIEQWVLWRAVQHEATAEKPPRTEKVPYQSNGRNASSTKASTWTDFESVIMTYEAEDEDYSGVGFVVKKDNGITVLDFDHVRNGETGEIDPYILGAVQYLGSYAEISPSGTGIRVIGYGTLDKAINSTILQGWVEGRYVTITGHHLPGLPIDLAPIDPIKLQEIIDHYSDAPKKTATTGAFTNSFLPPRQIDATQCLEIRQALGYIDPDESYDTWLQIGMALHSENASNAFGLWNEWSQGGPKYDSKAIRAKWRSFTDKPNGIGLSSIFAMAQQRGWVNPASKIAQGVPVVSIAQASTALPVYERTTKTADFPSHLLAPPGVLGNMLAWGLRTAHRPLPHLALQAVLVTASMAMARRYKTNNNNWVQIWMLGIAKTCSGKEHGKTIIEEVLSASGLGDRIAGSGYTSPGAVFSTLLDKPAHVALIDEFGKLIESSQAHGNQSKTDAITMLMEVFGRGHGTLRPASYSLMALTKEQRDILQSRKICKPSIGVLAMTTPSMFYNSLSAKWIADGFLGRFSVMSSPIGRQLSEYPDHEDVPDTVVDWMREVSLATDSTGNLASATTGADMEPTPIKLKFSTESVAMLKGFESDIIKRMDNIERVGLEALYGRTVEKAMRLAMVIALAESPGARIIGSTPLQWAIDYTLTCDSSLVEEARKYVADSPFARLKTTCLELIRAAGANGLTMRELNKKSSAFDGLRPKDQQELIEALTGEGTIQFQKIATPKNRGRKRVAFVAVQVEDDD